MQKITTTLNFGGFYGSIHAENIDNIIEDEFEYIKETKLLIDNNIFSYIDYKKIYEAYAQYLVADINDKCNLKLQFLNVDSPREHNFKTDVIMVEMEISDYNKLLLECDREYIKDRLTRATTICDGYIPYYTYDEILEQPNFIAEFLLDEVYNEYEYSTGEWLYDDTSFITDEVYKAINKIKGE